MSILLIFFLLFSLALAPQDYFGRGAGFRGRPVVAAGRGVVVLLAGHTALVPEACPIYKDIPLFIIRKRFSFIHRSLIVFALRPESLIKGATAIAQAAYDLADRHVVYLLLLYGDRAVTPVLLLDDRQPFTFRFFLLGRAVILRVILVRLRFVLVERAAKFCSWPN